MIDHVLHFVAPAGYALLPPRMKSPAATAMLLAIGLQESRFLARRQHDNGPARGFWQFERAGVRGVLSHTRSRTHIGKALKALMYAPSSTGWGITECHDALEHNDTLAFCFARLLLYTLPEELPGRLEGAEGWRQYLKAWRPGAPWEATWDAMYTEAWDRVDIMEE